MKQAAVVCALALTMVAGAARADEFPDGATKPSADEIRQYVEGKTFNVKVSTGATWRMVYKADGSMAVDSDRGGNTFRGTWSQADGNLCTQPLGKVRGCNEVRMIGGVLHMKRDNGDIIQYTP